jgi:hypothetical protein
MRGRCGREEPRSETHVSVIAADDEDVNGQDVCQMHTHETA